MKPLALVVFLVAAGCASHHAQLAFKVIPSQPSYLLRSPELKDTTFPETPGLFTAVGSGWVDLRPQMSLRIENAYYREGAPKHGLDGFLGTEIATYRVRRGLRLVSTESKLERRPSDQAAVQDLISQVQRRYREHRFFYQIVFKLKGDSRGAVLLGGRSKEEVDRLGARLIQDPESVCGENGSVRCTIFPAACSVALEMQVFVNGEPKTVAWGSLLRSVVGNAKRFELVRLHHGRATPVELDPSDPNILLLPLLPGDRVTLS
ncbi:MAG TPA: hypothetical protein VEV37_02225 [Bryobacteraceae bacterium]|nr:hypothetical protein [Bryobacteraceae bacterium]